MQDIYYAIVYYFIFTLFGILGFLLLNSTLPKHRVLAYLISKPIGLAVFGYPIWVLSSMKILNINPDYIVQSLFFIIMIIVISYFVIKLFNITEKNPEFLRKNRSFFLKILLMEYISIMLFAGYLYIRSFNPNIEGTEKFMDLHLLMSAGKTEYFPFFDGWWAGKNINYYYYGFYLFALPAKIGSIPYSVVYNLSLGIIFVQTFILSASIAYRVLRNKITAFFAACLVVFAGNLHYASCVVNNIGDNLSSQCFYPKATRILDPAYTINEIPSYSFILGDLHPHVLSLMFFLLGIYLLIENYKSKEVNLYLHAIFVFIIATAGIINFWDFMTLGVFYALTLFAKYLFKLKKSKWNLRDFIHKNQSNLSYSIIISIILALSPFLIYSLFFLYFKSPVTGIGFAPEFVEAQKRVKEQDMQYPSSFGFLFGIWGTYIILIFVSLIAIFLSRKFSFKNLSIPIIMTFLSITLIIFTELFFFQDLFHVANPPYFRANTVFKLTYHSWILFGLATALFIGFAWDSLKNIKNRVYGLGMDIGFIVIVSYFFTLVLIYPFIATIQAFNPVFPNEAITQNRSLTLDGTKFIEIKNPADYKAIQWLNENQKTRVVILEASGSAYTFYGRIGVHTGMGNILNWETHQWTWRFAYPQNIKKWQDTVGVGIDTGYGEIAKAKEEVRIAYESESIEQTKEILTKYNVKYVYIGNLEKTTYPSLNKNKFLNIGEVVMTYEDSVLIRLYD